jgi:glycosyltransferase involved in cell wall biosynthesis
MMSSVTVAIPTRGDRPSIAQTIESIVASAGGRPFELLVVWSGNVSAPIWSNTLPGEPRHLPVPRLGLSIARNAALGFASGGLILMADDDVICTSDWFEAMVSALMEGSDIVGGPVSCNWPKGRPAWMRVEMEAIFGSFDAGTESKDLVPGQGLVGSNMGMRRERVLALGAYDVILGTTGRGGGMGEENDLCDRALALGLRVRYVADARVNHMIEAQAATRRSYLRRMYRFGRSMAIVRSQEGPGRSRKIASAAKRVVRAPFVTDRMEELGSAFFELGSVTASLMGTATR